MSKAMRLREISNRRAAEARKSRLAEQRKARAKLQLDVLRLKQAGLLAADFSLEA